MKTSNNHFAGKLLYALLFLLVIPLGLWFWAGATEDLIGFPAVQSTAGGWILMGAGVGLMLWAMAALKIRGEGLPMNAYPPKKFVRSGPYRLFRHPIYWGFAFFLIGLFLYTGSASGLWLVTPISILSMIALVTGYEALDLRVRFPGQSIRTVLALLAAGPERPQLRDRLASLFWVGSLWLVVNTILHLLLSHSPSLFDLSILVPTLPQAAYYLSIFLVLLVPFLLTSRTQLRVWSVSALLGLALYLYVSLVFPRIGTRLLEPGSTSWLAMPLFLLLLSIRPLFQRSRTAGWLMAVVVLALVVTRLTVSPWILLQLAVHSGIYLLATNADRIWQFLRMEAELVANSWQEWVFGKIRVINHGFYVGFGAFFGILLAGILAGAAYAWGILAFTFTVIVFSALWAQLIEGSEKLKRPFGYYGALVGIIFGSLLVRLLGFNGWVIIGTVSVVMPWVQAIGRLRCLVNGCCHGHPVDNPEVGIRYFHERSRVCGISGLKGELLHPTPLYAILWLFLVGFILLGLWNHHYSAPFIFGLYLILTGLGRFVEEAYRGEVQTPILRGLRLYQWTAILSVLIGIGFTLITVEPFFLRPDFSWNTVLAAALGGLFTAFAMGVDFPYSNARFSRLV
ncbi:prolipoprotein diacylglyceryl transferase family protein [Flavilitoribacter nigricans]|uniref:Diacylglyceryl transferase n=1 Tax=Flavilitoribacter nigricans (strain ATCC 23147 / DSM 23189 / NBRC 102662 / NCIMB 1420 / SS-2) TaxID=1122177 RepID=A0A2D0NAK2_FLAN2|nr:prolipoprotein diacylglyceryl transferase family protein [Flavilitoribacter nigricans]PHN05507.1 hypothetical protein CRP01_16050 [Flavilitoribacter nigricans DSM 23189 = NBRC 102662]